MAFLVHVSSSESREIHAFRMDPDTGRLHLHEVIDVPGTGAPTRGNIPLAWSRDRKYLYAQIRIAPFPLSTFAMDPASAHLELLDTVPMPVPMAYLCASSDGEHLFGASYDGAMLSVNRIEPSGRISVPCLQTLSTPPKAHCIVEAPFGGFVYATSVDGEVILCYRLDASGAIDEATRTDTTTRPGAGPRHLVFHPTQDRLYCINETAGSVAVYSVDRLSGALGELQYTSLMPAEFSGRALGADIRLVPDGTLLYASVRKTHAITGFRIDPMHGTLDCIGTFDVEAYPRGFAITPNGRFLLCAGQQSNHIGVLGIDRGTGALAPVERHPVGLRPSWIEITQTAGAPA